MYYTRREQPLRFGLWFCGNGVASMLGGLIAYGIGHIDAALHPWQYLFLIFGAITAAYGILMTILLPDSPSKALWLTPTERIAAVDRLKNDTSGAIKSTFKWYQVSEALRDPVTWFLALYVFCSNIANGGLTSFGSLVIQGFGYKGLQALLIQMPTGAAQLGFVIVGCILATVVKNVRTISMIILTCISLVGIVLMYALEASNRSGRLAGFCLSLAFAANMPLSLSLVASNVGGFTKRAVVNASVLVAYCAGNIAGPQFFSVDEAPNYPRGIKACLAGFCLGVFWLVCLFFYLVWMNRKRDADGDVDLDAPVSRELMLEDRTDWEVQRRYVL
jgi:MFS family permease